MERTRSRFRRALFVIVPALALGALAIPTALAWGHGHHHAKTAAELNEHLERGLDHLLDRVDATDAQRERANAIAARRSPELFALMSEGRSVRQQLKQVLLAEQLDKAQLAQLRVQLDTLANRATDIGLSSVYELADVLTPAQRKELADRLSRFEH
jgi:periplasmic protein CpxP/Spy